MRKSLSFLILSIIFLSLTIVGLVIPAHAVVYPVGYPVGEQSGGWFNTYFTNMFSGTGISESTPTYLSGCAMGEVMRGFSNTGMLLCISPGLNSTSSATLALSGALIGVPNYIAKYTPTGTGINISQIYDNGTNVGIATTTPGAKLEVAGQVKITGGAPALGRVLTSDATGLATWGLPPSPCLPGGTGLDNTCYGVNSLQVNTTGYSNVANGKYTLYTNNTGFQNTAIGAESMRYNTTGFSNTANGYRSLFSNTTGLANTAIGYTALSANIGGWLNTAIGNYSLYSNITGNENTALGNNAGYNITSGDNNTAIGANTNFPIATASNQLNIGNAIFGIGLNGTVGAPAGNIGIGTNNPTTKLEVAGQIKITGGAPGLGKTLVSDATGLATWTSTVSGSTATGIIGGSGSQNYLSKFGTGGLGIYISQLFDNGTDVGIGTITPTAKLEVAGQVKITGGLPGAGKVLSSDASGLASWVSLSAVSGVWSILGNSGTVAGTNFLGTTDNVALVFKTNNIETMRVLTTGDVGIGTSTPGAKLEVAGQVKITGGIPGAGKVLTSDATGLAIWSPPGAGYPCVPGGSMPTNTCYGTGSMSSILNGDKNAGYGAFSLFSLQNGDNNTAIGHEALYTNVNGNRNTAVGYQASYILTNPSSDNTSIGYRAGYNITSGDNNTAIGANTNFPIATASNQLNIGNAIFGIGLNGTVGAPAGNIGIGTNNPTTKLEVAGQIKITGGAPGLGKTLVSDATGLATWTSTVSGSTATGIIGGSGSQNYLSKFGTGGLGIYISQLFDNGTDVGIGTITPTAKLEVAGQVKITGGIPGLGKVLTSDASGLAIWSSSVSGSTATGIIGGSGSQNYIPKFGTGGVGIYVSQLFDNGTDVGIGTTTPDTKLTLDSGLDDATGLRLSRMNTLSPVYTGQTVGLGIDALGNVVPISNGDVVVYDGIGRNGITPTPNPDLAGRKISYDFNKYFMIPTKQSFVVSDGNGPGYNAPYFKENGTSGLCSWNGASGTSPYDCTVPDTGGTNLSASPNNSFTMTARGNNYGYQMALGARGDAPLFARSGKWYNGTTNYGSGLYLADAITPMPWQKVLTIPANHTEYLFIDTGFNSQLIPSNGGGRVGIGTSFPASRFEVWTGATTQSLLHFRGLNNTAIGLGALNAVPGSGAVTAYNDNTAVGYNAGSNLTTGSDNIMIGSDARAQANNSSSTLNIGNTIFGNSLPTSFGGVAGNVGIGVVAPTQQLDIAKSMNLSATTGSVIAGVIYKGGTRFIHNYSRNVSPSTNLFVGLNAGNFTMGTGAGMDPIFYGTENVGIGTNALTANTTGYSNTALGHNALAANTAGSSNMAIGWGSLASNTAGSSNTAIGRSSLNFNSTASNNTAIGYQSLQSNTSGGNNTAVGVSALSSNISGGSNTANGYQSLTLNTTGNGNTANGYQAMGKNDSGISNIAYGFQALYNNISGSQNTALGGFAGNTITGNSNIAIGYNAQVGSPAGSSQLSIGNWIYGSGGNIGIGISAPTAKLEINGQLKITGGSPGNGKILVSDAVGLATWQVPSGGAIIPWAVAGNSGTIAASNFVGTIDTVDLVFRTNNIERMRFTSSGMVGVRTATPRGLLDVTAGTGVAGNPGLGIFLKGEDAPAGNYSGGTIFLNPGLKTGTGTAGIVAIGFTPTELLAANWLGNNALYSKGYAYFQGGYLAGNATGMQWGTSSTRLMGAGSSNTADYMSFTTNNVERIRINGSGNIGINTATPDPTTSMDINGLVRIRGGIPGNGKVLVSDATGIASWQNLSGASGALASWSIAGNSGTVATTNFIGTTDANPLVFRTNNIERMRVDTTGNLGLGVANPTVKLDVAGLIRSTNNGAAYFQGGDDAQLWDVNVANTVAIRGLSNSALGNLQLGSNAAAYIAGSGANIGIGVINPVAKLDISGQIKISGGVPGLGKVLTSDATGLASWSTAPTSITEWSKTGNSILGTDFLGSTNAQDLIFKTNNIERARILQNGNISINSMILGRGGNGSQASTTTLGVSALLLNTLGISNTAMGNSALASNISGGFNTAMGHGALFGNTGNNNTAIGYNAGTAITSGANNIAIGYNAAVPLATGSNQLSIGNWIYGVGGNIGIRTSTPGQALTVSGSIQMIDGNQGTGKYLVSDANGVASWKTPSSAGTGTYIYRLTNVLSISSTTAANVTELTSDALPMGPFQFELIGRFQSAISSNGIGMTLANVSATSTDFIGTVSSQLTNSTQYISSFTSPGTLVVSSAVPAANTDYAILMKGTFNVTATGTVAVRLSSENNGQNVTLQPGTVLIIKSLDPTLGVSGL